MPLFRRYILLLLTLLSFTLQAQQYPVDVQVFVTPPYPQSLRGYADTFEQKIQAHFLLKDLSTGGRPFVLRFSLEDFQGQVIAQTPDYITPYLVNLSPGVRRTLTNIDFKTLLRYENLYGINEATYNGLLPEGTYFIGLSLYDVATGRPVSNKGRAMIQVRRYSPPVLTMPQKGEVLTKKNAFQHIVFQWMPRDVAPFMQYEFTLKEVWDLALVPEEAFMTGRLVYQTKTFSPALAYTNMMPILLENKRYVWQVRAFTNNPNNPNEQSYFKNNGNSETFYFDLVSHCEAPKFLTAITESTSAQLRWSAQAMMPNQEYPYKVMYREKGKTWKSQKVSMPYAKVTGLKRGRTYIYKVGVACGLETAYSSSVFGEESYMYSTEQEFTTTEQIDEKSQVQCGVKPEIRIKNTNPLQDNLYPNTTFTAGDFPVTVLNATGNNGVYSGEGYVKVPYLQDTKIKVVFNGIKLNTERQLIEGKLVTTYDETERNVVEVPIIKTLSDAINSLKNVGKQQEEIVQNQEKLEKQFSENKIDKEEYDKKTKENISQWEKTLSVYNDVESFTEKHPLITKEEVNELKELQQQKSFAGNSVGKKDLENTKKINARQTETIEKLLKKEDEIRKLIDDFIANCPDCQNPKLFLDALVQIAQNVGRKEAENSIKKWEEYFRTGVASTEAIKVNICLGLEKKIEIRSKNGYFEKIYEQIPRRTYKSSMEALGFYNTYSYADAIVINGKKINYTGEIKIKPKEEFNICCVELKAGNLTYNAKETNQIWFLNDKNIYTAKLIFSSKDDIDLVWKYYYIKNKNETKENVIKEYDKIHKTNFYNLILRKVKK